MHGQEMRWSSLQTVAENPLPKRIRAAKQRLLCVAAVR
jgi:hypothetical protein